MNITLNTVYSKIVKSFGSEGFVLNDNTDSRSTISRNIYNKSNNNIKYTITLFILGDFIIIKSNNECVGKISFDNIQVLEEALVEVFASKGVVLNNNKVEAEVEKNVVADKNESESDTLSLLDKTYSKMIDIFNESEFGDTGFNFYESCEDVGFKGEISRSIYNKSGCDVKDVIRIFTIGNFIAVKSRKDLLARISYDNIAVLKEVLVNVFRSKGVELNLR